MELYLLNTLSANKQLQAVRKKKEGAKICSKSLD
jgi:hypothetical protein